MVNYNINVLNYVKALNIKERIKLYKKNNISNMSYDDYQNWVNIRGIVTENDIKKMLEVEEITGEQLNSALKKLTDEEINKIASQIKNKKWINDYKKIMERYNNVYKKIKYKNDQIDLGISVSPFLIYINTSLLKIKNNLTNIKVSDKVVESMCTKCASVLLDLIIKTLVWDFRSKTEIRDDSDEEITDDLLKKYMYETFYSTNNIIVFYDQYPVCARRVTCKTMELISHFTELLQRLDENFDGICKELELNKVEELIDVDADQGDTHEQGRFVVKLEFNNDVIIYKPKDLKIEKVFFDLISEFCERYNLLDLFTNKYFIGSDFTFEKYVRYESCSNKKQIENYYKRFGQLCALVFLFRGNDIHYENIIAYNEYPVIIDMETLFQHQLDIISMEESAFVKVYRESINSICGTALFPLISFIDGKEGKGVDISALNGSGTTLPYKILQLVNHQNDNIRFDYEEAEIEDKKNIPLLNGEKINFFYYSDFIIQSFEKTMMTIAENKEYFIGLNGTINKFKGLKTRQLMRATSSYAKMMSFSSHPNYSTDMINLERLFCNVWNYPFKDKRIISAEVSDMISGDIPIFYKIVDDKSIITSNGKVLLDYFEVTGYDKVISYIDKLDYKEITKQVSQAKVSMGLFEVMNDISRIDTKEKTDIIKYPLERESKSVLLNHAYSIADEIIYSATTDLETRTIDWANASFDENHKIWKISSVTHSFSRGSMGVLYFLIKLSKYTNKYEEYINLIITSFIEQNLDYLPLGLKDGMAGILYVLLSTYNVKTDNSIKSLVYKIYQDLDMRIKGLKDISFKNGLLGIINILVEAYKLLKDNVFLDKVIEYIDLYKTLLKSKNNAISLDDKKKIFYVMSKIEDLEGGAIFNDVLEIVQYEGEELSENYEIDLVMDLFDVNIKQLESGIDEYMLTHYDTFENGVSGIIYSLLLKGNIEDAIEVVNKLLKNKESSDYCYKTVPGYSTVGFINGLVGIGYVLLATLDASKLEIPLVTII
mgnify:CR=1 FL=1